ncbi:MAG: hypothetical protein A2W31_09495 [Planctomycetes bacterium RBG_16_64_10]|nr:MAG: hypothetical protein A2W31_09495 [Planctomycetes bacterium RBG_16_64_10]
MASQLNAAHHSLAATQHRRRWGRFVVDVGRLVVEVDPQDRRPAEVLDESFGGIGLAMDDVSRLVPGAELSLWYDGTLMRGVVRNIVPSGDGRFRVGVEWHLGDATSEEPDAGAARIEGCLFVLFRMWEAGRSDEVVAEVTKLQQEATRDGRSRLAGCAGELLTVLRDRPLSGVGDQLARLVDACTAAER